MDLAVHSFSERPSASDPAHRRLGLLSLGVVTFLAVILTACSGLQVSKNSVSGTIGGHSFSGSTGALPAGFPSSVPIPDHYRVIAGGGTNNRWDVGFAVVGSISTGTASYQSKFTTAGYSISNNQSGTTPGISGSGSTSTTLTVSGSIFTAKSAQWTVEVVAASTTGSTGGNLKPGEFAINIVVLPTTATTTPST